MKTNAITLIESPRTAWQGLAKPVPVEIKADYLRLLFAAGFRQVDAVSFASGDADPVLALADPPKDVDVFGLVTDRKAADRAIATGAVTTLIVPYSVSPEFLRRSLNLSPEESMDALDAIGEASYKAGVGLAVSVAMAFGNPFGDAWDVDEVAAACELLVDSGIERIVLEDTTGQSTPEGIDTVFEAAQSALGEEAVLSLHLYTAPDTAAEKIRAAYEAGCRHFHSAIGGVGGAPFAMDAQASNLATEVLLEELARLGPELPKLEPLESLIKLSRGIGEKFGSAVQ